MTITLTTDQTEQVPLKSTKL